MQDNRIVYKGKKINIVKLKRPVGFFLLFIGIAFWRWFMTGNLFYLFNFGYIGLSIAIGFYFNDVISGSKKLWGRRITQLLVGTYMLLFLGFFGKENMQLEGFFIYLFSGVFAAATLHYFIAKIVGPLIFGRGWCGYACWTAMVLDLFPYKKPKNGRLKKYGIIRYIHFGFSFIVVIILWKLIGLTYLGHETMVDLIMLIIGNVFYYVIGISLAFVLKDNRAFCKYVCPIPVFQKITTPFSLMKIEIDKDKCNDCGLCEKLCPMNIKLLSYKNKDKRIMSGECINCGTCENNCPNCAIKTTFKLDGEYLEYINYER